MSEAHKIEPDVRELIALMDRWDEDRGRDRGTGWRRELARIGDLDRFMVRAERSEALKEGSGVDHGE